MSNNLSKASSQTGNFLAIIGPGLIVAATGVGAGDLATGAFSGSKLGVTVLWAVLMGAGLKYVLTEGLARYQLATGETLLEGAISQFGKVFQFVFLGYLLLWSFFVGSALMSACGVTAHAIFPVFDATTGKIVFGLLHSAVAIVLVRRGGYALFEKIMGVSIAVMFVTVIVTALMVRPEWGQLARGLFVVNFFNQEPDAQQWIIALMGGVGGTLTILCYGYWIREEGREGIDQLKTCRIDLATGYIMTALFGLGMVVIGSKIQVDGKGSQLIVLLAEKLQTELGAWGTVGKWMFLVGAWGAVSSSLLGVWQSVPYLFADFWRLSVFSPDDNHTSGKKQPINTSGKPYRIYLCALATFPAAGLWFKFEDIQKLYAIIGAFFIPLLAVALFFLNGNSKRVGNQGKNSVPTTILLAGTLLFFSYIGWQIIQKALGM